MGIVASNFKKWPRTTKGIHIIFLAILGWVILVDTQKSNVSPSGITLASAAYFLCLLPTYLYFKRGEVSVPFFPLYGLVYFTYYIYPIFGNPDIGLGTETRDINKALILVLLGFLFMCLAFYTPLGGVCRKLPRLKIEWETRKALNFSIYTGLAGLLNKYAAVSNWIAAEVISLFNFLSELSLFAIVMLFILDLQKKNNLFGRIFLWGLLIPARAVLNIVAGATQGLFLDMSVIMLVYAYQRRKIPWAALILSAVIFFVVFGARDEYRFQVSEKSAIETQTTSQKALLYINVVKNKLTGNKDEIFIAYQKLSKRTDSVSIFAQVVYLTPEFIPYWNGYTYRALIYNFFPRLIFTDKPLKTLGQEFGHRYEFLHYTDNKTSFNVPQIIEMYANFGVAGVIIGMFLTGLLYRGVYILLNRPDAGEGGFIICLVISRILLNIESDFSVVFGNLFYYIIFFYFVLKLIKPPGIRAPHQSQG